MRGGEPLALPPLRALSCEGRAPSRSPAEGSRPRAFRYILSMIASPNSEHLSSVAPVMSRSKS